MFKYLPKKCSKILKIALKAESKYVGDRYCDVGISDLSTIMWVMIGGSWPINSRDVTERMADRLNWADDIANHRVHKMDSEIMNLIFTLKKGPDANYACWNEILLIPFTPYSESITLWREYMTSVIKVLEAYGI